MIKKQTKDSIATVTFNNPTALNALEPKMAEGFRDALNEFSSDNGVNCLIVGGEGPAFMSGGDLRHFYGNLDTIEETITRLISIYHDIILTMTRMEKPVITRVHGAVAGGGIGMALAGDYVIAAENTIFTMAYTAIGASPDGGSTYFLPRLIGRRASMEMALLNRPVDAQKALSLGLINEVVPLKQLEEASFSVAQKLSLGASKAIGEAKLLINKSFESEDLNTHLESELNAFRRCCVSGDFKEGLAAFLEKRKPFFKGV